VAGRLDLGPHLVGQLVDRLDLLVVGEEHDLDAPGGGAPITRSGVTMPPCAD